jgi:hypothetical protein
VPYYIVPRVSSDVTAALEPRRVAPGEPGSVLLENRGSTVAGTADFYAWGLASGKAPGIAGHVDLHAAGVQSLANGEILVFAITTKKAWSSPVTQAFSVFVDSNRDGEVDFEVFSFDIGRVVNGLFDGRVGTFVFDAATGNLSLFYLASASTDGSSILLPVPAAAIGVTPSNPRFAYTAASWAFNGDTDAFESWAVFNAFSNAITTGAFEVVNPGDRIRVPFSVDASEWSATPALGLMIVSPDNRNGTDEANLVRVRVR